MFNTLLFCVTMVPAMQALLTSETGNGRLQGLSSAPINNGRYNYPSFRRNVKESALAVPGGLPRSEFLRLDTGADEELLEDYSLLDPQDLSLETSSREERSPRRCVQLLESCVGHVPCCSPCATCYCRFFNAFCYCRKTNCHQGKN
ncbi:agouti-related protein [Bombina bombina]|uniref:agouti-related protein n=1 Tax=Bombina bombina TaxID=8345 RepID=UPI00235AB355|nr:agouti-related protein [Bombina bombina]